MSRKKKKDNNPAGIIISLIILIALCVAGGFVWLNRYEFFPGLIKNGVSVCFLGKNGENKIVKYNYEGVNGVNEGVNGVNGEAAVPSQTRFEFAIRKLIAGPSDIQRMLNIYSEIPSDTKILAIIQEPDKNIIDLTPAFNTGGGTESIYKKLTQLIETVNLNTDKPTYLFINGVQTEVFGGEGIMITQPLTKDSL